MSLSTIAVIEKIARMAIRKACETDERDRAEWRGKWTVTPFGEQDGKPLWRCRADEKDPLHLHVYRSGLDYLALPLYPEEIVSDGGSIPKALQGVKQLHLKPDDFLRSYAGMHDPLYALAKVRVRDPLITSAWTRIDIDRADSDLLLFLGLTCDRRADGQTPSIADANLIYRAVQAGGGRAWDRHRLLER